MTDNKLKRKTINWIAFGVMLFFFVSCSVNKNYTGYYKDTTIKGAYCFRTITLNKDSTAIFTWWTDILMINKGSWSISNDTIVFVDSSHIKMNTFFVIENGKLIDPTNRRVYEKN